MGQRRESVKAKARFVAHFGRSGSSRGRLALLAFSAAALFLFIPASSAFAEIIVNLNGTGTGSVESNVAGNGGNKIECSNIGGGPAGPQCSEEFPAFISAFEFNAVLLKASPAVDSYFAGWTGDDPNGGFAGPTCNTGAAIPCSVIDFGEFGEPPVHITATFKLIPDPPVAVTSASGPGANEFLTTIEGTVNPEGAEVEGCRFEYGPTTAYGSSLPCDPEASALGEGTTDEEVSAEVELEGLNPDTTYHYRLVASNLSGTSKGEDRTFTTGPAPPDGCPNAAIRDTQAFGAILLPDCMAFEMVSPPAKAGQPASAPAASAEGERVSFKSIAALGGTPGPIHLQGDPYIATRGESGWSTAPTSPPANIFAGWDNYATASSFTPDFSRWFQLAATRTQYYVGVGQAFQGGLGGLFAPISPLLTPLNRNISDRKPFEIVQVSRFQGASVDHSHLYFTPGPRQVANATAYLPGDPEPSGSAADSNAYVAHLDSNGQPSLELLAGDHSGKAWGGACGARLGGVRSFFPEPTGERNQGAISADGERVYFTTRPGQPEAAAACDSENKLRILERLESEAHGVHIEELFSPECSRSGPPCNNADGNDYYQGASTDGTMVYFTTTRQLADSDLDTGTDCSTELGESAGCDLYLYDSSLPIGHRLVQVSAGEASAPTPGEGANVLKGATAISGDGSHVYFVAQGILTTDLNAEEEEAQEGQPNLYVWDRATEETAFVGTLDSGDGEFLWGANNSFSGLLAVPELGDGHILSFYSRAPLTANDSDGTYSDVFRYDAGSKELECVSCIGAGDSAPFDAAEGQNPATLGTDRGEWGRQISEEGETIVFSTAEGLVPGDVNEIKDDYLWREGQLFRLPGTARGLFAGIAGAALSHDGSTVAFQTPAALLPQDGDTSVDVYVARAGGGFPQPEEAAPCQPDESLPGAPCQEGGQQPTPPNATSANAVTAGNPLRKPSCAKGKVRRNGRCVKPRKRHHRKHARHANADRRAAK
jgi:hypothetical protein